MKCDCVNSFVSNAFRKLGLMVGEKPVYFIIAPVLLSVILATGVLRLRYEDDTEYLFTPTDGIGKEERRIVETLFPMNSSNDFDAGRLNRVSPFADILIEARDGKSIFEKDVFSDVKLIDQMIQNLTISYDNREWRYQDMCARRNKKCFANYIFSFENRLDDMETGIYTIEYPLMIKEVPFQLFFSAAVLGDVKTDEFSKIKKARALKLLYFLDNDGPKKLERAHLWEKAISKMMENSQLQLVKIACMTSLFFNEEVEKNAISVIPLFSITIVIMLLFSTFACMMLDWVKSKPWLGVMGFFSSIIGVVGAFGFTMHCGLEFIGLNLAAPFLMLGIGMDDTFVLLAAWRRTDNKLTVPERMSKAYAEAALSVTITSLTNFLSFCVGVFTPFVSVRIFCIYTAVAVLFTYIYHITFFGGCMALLGHLEERNLHSLLCVPATPKSLASGKGICFKLFCTGGKNPLDPDNLQDNQEHMVMKCFRDQLGNLLSTKLSKACVILGFLMYLSFAVWGCAQINEGLELHKISRYDSHMMQFHKLRDKYFKKFPHRIQVIINQTLNYADPKVQQQIEEILDTLEVNRFMAGPRYTESWLRIYREFMEDKRSQIFLWGYNMSKKEDFYRGIHKVFFKLSHDYFKQDIKFNEDFSEITATRFVVQSMNIMNTNDERDMMMELRSLASRAPVSVRVYNYFFPFFDQYTRVKGVTVQAVGVATAMMTLVTFIFINSICAFWVAVSIVSIEIGLVGYMSWWNVSLDGVSMINIIQCIGFSVDYSAHITYAYISAKEKEPNKRLRSALYFMGLPIAQGSISTIIGVSILNFAPSYIYSVFFKSVFLVMLFGAIHGLVFLPVFLTLTDMLFDRMLSSRAKHDGSPSCSITNNDHDMPTDQKGITTLADSSYPAQVEDSAVMHIAAERYLGIGDFKAEGESKGIRGVCSGNMNCAEMLHAPPIPLKVFGDMGDFSRCRGQIYPG